MLIKSRTKIIFFSSRSLIDIFQFLEKMQWENNFIQTLKYLDQEIQFFWYVMILIFRLGHVNEFKTIPQALFMCPGYCLVSWNSRKGTQTTTTVGCAGGTPPDAAQIPCHTLERGEKKTIRHWGTGANLVLMEMELLQIWVAAVHDRSTLRAFCTAHMILAQLYIRGVWAELFKSSCRALTRIFHMMTWILTALKFYSTFNLVRI